MKSDILRLDKVNKAFGPVEVLRNLSLCVERGEFTAIVGPSGCGKTTLLNLLSGYDSASSGAIERHGDVRMVYQQDGLFPWRTVVQNIEMGLRHVADSVARHRELRSLIELIGLQGFENHYPHQLSGGMRQRVELARALAAEADILLMDEPFSALDYLTRLKMRGELARLLQERPRTVVLVTHDIEEAAQLADRIVVLSERPAQIRRELRIDLQRPRNLTHPDVVDAMHSVLMELGLEDSNGEATLPRTLVHAAGGNGLSLSLGED